MNLHRIIARILAISALGVAPVVLSSTPASASSAATQAECDPGGSTGQSWGDAGITTDRPVVASFTVDGQTVADPVTPAVGHLGIAICPETAGARKTGLTIFKHEGLNSNPADLTGALRPDGTPVTTDSVYEVTITHFGALAKYFSFALVHGHVQTWTADGLGTDAASLTFSVTAAIDPGVDTPYYQCSATPPECSAPQAIGENNGVSMQLDLDQAGSFKTFTGAYFDLDRAVAGFAEAKTNTDGTKYLQMTLGGPHLALDGSANVGSMDAFLPNATLQTLFGTSDASLAESLAVTRTESGTSSAASYTATAVTGGLKVHVPGITFSTPVYKVSKVKASTTTASTTKLMWPAVSIDAPSNGSGYWIAASDGTVRAFGGAAANAPLTARLNAPVVDLATSPASANSYYLVATDGGVFSFGDAKFYGSTGNLKLNQPVVGMAVSPTGKGYWMVARDGGIFNYGDAAFYGSTGAMTLNKPIVGMASTPTGKGYWLVASDGGIFAFGDAVFYGSTGAINLNQPVVGITSSPSGKGYWMVARDGGIFNYGDASFYGSTGAIKLNKPVTSIAATPTGKGYWMVGSDGGVFNYGDATFSGSAA
jgi:hypothetical protein